jgi:photosystem II stability/assembly factor-like uncharacterized protein
MTFHLFCYLLFLACQHVAHTDKVLPTSEQTNRASPPIVQSTIVHNPEAMWHWDRTIVNKKHDLRAIHFTSESNGWIGSSDGTLYETNDGGRSWQKRNVPKLPGSDVSSIYFVDPTNGWVIVAKNPPDPMDSDGYQSEVVHTNDGGKSWRRQYWGSGLQLYRILFLNDQEGWLAGRSLDKGAFVLHTTDQGAHWTDAVGNLGTELLGDYASDVLPIAPKVARLLTARGKVFTTQDAGSSWTEVEAIRGEPLQVYISRLGIGPAGNSWILGGADSKEGVWTTLSVRAANGTFNNYHLDDVYLVDAIFLSDNQVLACGSVAIALDQSEGTILYSNDAGRNWTVVYRNKQIRRLNSFATGQANHVWAVGDNGLVLRSESVADGMLTRNTK